MSGIKKSKHLKTAALCRWIARISGTLLIILILPFAIEYKSDLLTETGGVRIFFLGTGIVMIGILVGWIRELAGGLISLGGFCLGFAALYSAVGVNVFYAPLALPGVLYLASAGLRHLHRLDVPNRGVKNPLT
ncbi:hypothetical protein P4B35_10315 [Pontiellaceae bacterium B12227]|nr:hypothetical protein [Pontiellaceae bacterium B12227]